MSTLPSSFTKEPAWKQEVNRRLAEHRNRKGMSLAEQDVCSAEGSAGDRVSQAAARVAARYAKAPSYSEMQAAEARAAVRAAEAATRAAIEAQAAAQAVLDHMETVADEPATNSPGIGWQDWNGRADSTSPLIGNESGIRWEQDLPERASAPALSTSSWSPSELEEDVYEPVEAAQPIAANLIEFPREIVATRRLRPRLAEASGGNDSDQLSIFEVDPGSISTEPMAHMVADPSWREIELDAQPQSLPDYYALTPDNPHKLYQAPFGRRMMAAIVDAALIVGIVCAIAYLIASNVDQLPQKRMAEICGVLAVLGFAGLYQWFFLTFAKVTPGMRYAQLSLCTFDENVPTRAQVKARLKAMLISVLPLGLGMLWSIFDEDQMSWHDRLSKTYLRLS